jgi:Sodium/hydrogen exchanger family
LSAFRLRTLTFGLLTLFYFIRAGSFVPIPALVAAPAAFLCFLAVKVAAKIVGVYPVTKIFGSPNKEAMYTTLLMSTGLTFGTISSLFGLSHGIIDQDQYSALVAAVIGSAVVPTVIANAFYLPRHLLPDAVDLAQPVRRIPVSANRLHGLLTASRASGPGNYTPASGWRVDAAERQCRVHDPRRKKCLRRQESARDSPSLLPLAWPAPSAGAPAPKIILPSSSAPFASATRRVSASLRSP